MLSYLWSDQSFIMVNKIIMKAAVFYKDLQPWEKL